MFDTKFNQKLNLLLFVLFDQMLYEQMHNMKKNTH
jgi:hypothetical protein